MTDTENKPKFTPGPWTLEHDPYEGYISVKTPRNCIAGSYSDDDEDIANFKLMAAAPDLYAALKVAKELLGCNWLRANAPYTLEVINDALDKAEGKS